MHYLPALLIVILTFSLPKSAHCQVDTTKIAADTLLVADSLALITDTLKNDTTGADSLAAKDLAQSLGIVISPDALPDIVTSTATDSAVMDMKNNLFYLYGKAQVNYQDLQLNAGKVIFAQKDNIVTAAPEFDSLGHFKEKPTFTQGQEKFTYDSMQYNFQSKRAIVRNVRSQYGEGYVHSEQVKRNPDQTIYGLRNVYTTCALDTPHFGIRARRIKVIPNKVVASGSANIQIEQVPTPLFLPFGMFPISQTQRSGFKLPMYSVEEDRGVGIVNGGYYFHFSEKVDLLMETSLYSKGSYVVSGVSTYSNRYKYTGGLSFTYSYDKRGEEYEPGSTTAKDFRVMWRHESDGKSRPGTRFSASVIFGTSSYNANNAYDVNQILQNQYTSNISYSKQWQNKPFSLTASARHSQNLQTGQVDVTLPDVNFFIAQLNPFQAKNSMGTRWYEKITTEYNVHALNKLTFYDSTFSFNTLNTNMMTNGVVHTIPVNASYNIFRFIQMGFNVTYHEYWLTQQVYRGYNSFTETEDTLRNRGFYTARDFSSSVNFNTRIYGVKMFKQGGLAGIRHVLSPNIGLTYTPDYAADPFNYYYQSITNPNAPAQYLSAYEYAGDLGISIPGLGSYGKYSSLLTFGLDNNLQIKTRSNKDSTGFKNISLIDNFSISSSYNLAADSFKWNNVTMRLFTNILNNMFSVTAGATFDPYVFDYELGRRIDQTRVDAGQGLMRFTNGNVGIAGGFQSKPKADNSKNPAAQTDEYKRMMQYGRYNDYVDFNIPWNFTYSYALTLANNYQRNTKRDSLVINQMVMGSFSFNITDRWKLDVSSGYNITTKELSSTQIQIFRDLHCWQMRLSTVPFGPSKNFTFQLNVKAQVLQDLKLVRRRDFRDAI